MRWFASRKARKDLLEKLEVEGIPEYKLHEVDVKRASEILKKHENFYLEFYVSSGEMKFRVVDKRSKRTQSNELRKALSRIKAKLPSDKHVLIGDEHVNAVMQLPQSKDFKAVVKQRKVGIKQVPTTDPDKLELLSHYSPQEIGPPAHDQDWEGAYIYANMYDTVDDIEEHLEISVENE